MYKTPNDIYKDKKCINVKNEYKLPEKNVNIKYQSKCTNFDENKYKQEGNGC